MENTPMGGYADSQKCVFFRWIAWGNYPKNILQKKHVTPKKVTKYEWSKQTGPSYKD
jgi:hypothetical protein